jgi:CheY-like chemotaxis protein
MALGQLQNDTRMGQTVPTPVLLYVEDDPTTSYLFKMAVAELDCKISLAVVSDGNAAGAFLHKQPPFEDAPVPDLIVLDLNLPGRSGFEILQDIRHDQELARLSVVIFTSSRRKADQDRAEQLGVKGFFHKPRDVDSFWQTVKQICDMFLQASRASTA